MVGGAVSGAKFAPFPSPLPPASSSPELLSPFVLPTVGSVFRPVNFLSLCLAIPQFKLLSHVSSLRLPSGHSGPVLTLSNAGRSSPFCPHLQVANAGIWGTFLLQVAFRHVICGFYLFFLPVRLPSEIQKLPPDPPVRGFPGVWKLPLLQHPSWDGFPSLALVSLFLSFIFCPTSFRRRWMSCFSGHLMSSASGQKLFCEVCTAFKCSFDEFVGEKVVSPSYSSAILAPPPLLAFFKLLVFSVHLHIFILWNDSFLSLFLFLYFIFIYQWYQ